ncbi:DUF1295 domain-containing protein [Variovorax saccharolyticus]|uniref:DUF1295 domain-containing protein n=1 Tax=Variovorax saccharolyticus TaxID=3053516 RepID=UPI00257565D0|nr:DUF1295 domain-containing protein [Variovorax sp. J31P216]MDM0024793.1 DUF1295 domain-containing protein [Variovorax sp. J31P216]
MPEQPALPQAALAGLALIAGIALLTWLISLRQRDASLADRAWPAFIGGAALVYAVQLPAAGTRGTAMAALAIAWALRLGLYITLRNRGHGEDRRYRQMRERNQPHFGLRSLYLVFGLQALLAWIVTAPLLAGMAAMRPFGWLDATGTALAAFGIVFEAIADAQMARFKSMPGQRGRVMDRGLWHYSRHPNYFGEACVWWGLWLMAVAGAGWGGAWAAVSPALMTLLLLRVSGVSLLEKDIAERRPAYRDYVARTNAFLPGPPRKEPA